jgi:polysaccharide chain length determinant protein (PEP-CTERM system associated)
MTQRELTAQDYIAMLRRRWVLIVILGLIGGPLAYGVSKFLPTKYKSQTLVLVEPPAVSAKIVEPVDTTSISERLASMKQQILSRTRLEPIIRQFGLYAADANQNSMDALVARLQSDIDVTPVMPMAQTQSSRLPGFFVNVTMYDPRLAQQVCAAVTSMFIEESLRVSQQHSEVTTDFLSQQLAEAKKQLDDQDGKLAAFKSRYIGALPDQEQTNLNLLTGLTSQLDAATQALGRAQQDKTFVESNLAQQVAAWQASQIGQNPETLDQQLAALQTQLTSLRARYTDDYPDVIKTKNDIAAVQAQNSASSARQKSVDAAKELKPAIEPPIIQQLRAQIHGYDQIITEKTRDQEQIKEQIKLYQGRVQSSPAVEEQYKELTRGYQTALDSYNELLRNKNNAEMSTELQRQQEGEQFRILDPANLPNAPSFPNRPLFALGGLGGGLGLGLAVAFLLEMRDTSLRSERDVEASLHLPVLAMVPAIEPIMTKKSKRSVLGTDDSELGLGARA